jgi:hypothetical protein
MTDNNTEKDTAGITANTLASGIKYAAVGAAFAVMTFGAKKYMYSASYNKYNLPDSKYSELFEEVLASLPIKTVDATKTLVSNLNWKVSQLSEEEMGELYSYTINQLGFFYNGVVGKGSYFPAEKISGLFKASMNNLSDDMTLVVSDEFNPSNVVPRIIELCVEATSYVTQCTNQEESDAMEGSMMFVAGAMTAAQVAVTNFEELLPLDIVAKYLGNNLFEVSDYDVAM